MSPEEAALSINKCQITKMELFSAHATQIFCVPMILFYRSGNDRSPFVTVIFDTGDF